MTVDDANSIYVGGISYESNQDTLRKAFEEYGEIVAVKSRGFGFVTFGNPRAAADAIRGMDGRTLDGRTIKVDGVKNRLSKTNGHEGDRRWRDRDVRQNRDRDRLGRGRYFSPLHKRRSSPNNFRAARGRSPPRRRSRSPRKARSPTPSQERRRTHSQSSPSNGSSERLQQNERNEDTSNELIKASGRSSKDSREKSSHYSKQMKEDLGKAILKREELQEQISNLKAENDSDRQTILDLQNQGQKLQELLGDAVTAASNRRSQLRKLQRAVLDVRECKKKLKASERDLETLLEAVSEDLDEAAAEAREDRYESHQNGDARFEQQVNDATKS